MRFLPKILLLLFCAFLITGVTIYLFFPETTLKIANQQRAAAANLIKENRLVKGYNFTLYTSSLSEKKDTLILLHGLADQKEGFLKMAKYLSEDYFIVIPDLLAHGENLKNENLNYEIQNQVKYLKYLFDELKLEKFHICGVATGGLLGIYFSSLYQTQVKSLTIVNTPFLDDSAKEYFDNFVKIPDEYTDVLFGLDLIFHKRPRLSWPITKLLRKQIGEDLDFSIKNMIRKNAFCIPQSVVSSINIPVLILHSPQDRLLSIDDALEYSELLPNSIYGTIKESGHYPQYENPPSLSASIQGQIERNK